MTLRVPFRRLGDDFVRAHRDNRWRTVGDLTSRNFEEITKWAGETSVRVDTLEAWNVSTSAFPNKRAYTVVPSATRTTTSATYVAWPVGETLVASFTKRLASTRLLVTLQTAQAVSASAAVDYAISVDGAADIQIKNGFVNTATAHHDAVGSVEVSGLAAGARSIALKARVGGGVTLTADVNDQVQLVVEEVA